MKPALFVPCLVLFASTMALLRLQMKCWRPGRSCLPPPSMAIFRGRIPRRRHFCTERQSSLFVHRAVTRGRAPCLSRSPRLPPPARHPCPDLSDFFARQTSVETAVALLRTPFGYFAYSSDAPYSSRCSVLLGAQYSSCSLLFYHTAQPVRRAQSVRTGAGTMPGSMWGPAG